MKAQTPENFRNVCLTRMVILSHKMTIKAIITEPILNVADVFSASTFAARRNVERDDNYGLASEQQINQPQCALAGAANQALVEPGVSAVRSVEEGGRVAASSTAGG